MNIFGAVPEAIVLRFGWTLIHTLWEGIAIAAVAAALLRAMSPTSAQARYLTACALMALLPLVVLATYAVLGTPQRSVVTSSASVHESPPPLAARVSPTLPSEDAPQSKIQTASLLRWLVGFWVLGVLVVAIRHALGWLLLCRWNRGRPMSELELVLPPLAKQLKIRREVRLIESLRFDVPAVVGVFRPIILLPVGLLCDLTPRQVELILIHELAHIARHDYLVNLLQVVLESLMFYHPATWWLSAHIRREREHCCDDIAANHCSNRGEYAHALLSLEHRRAPAMSPATAATGAIWRRASAAYCVWTIGRGDGHCDRWVLLCWRSSVWRLCWRSWPEKHRHRHPPPQLRPPRRQRPNSPSIRRFFRKIFNPAPRPTESFPTIWSR